MTVKSYLFALFLLFFSAHFLYPYLNSLCVSPHKPQNLLSAPSSHKTDHGSFNFTVIIKVLAFDRLESLSRCLNSLANADYDNDRVNLHIYLDHFVHADPIIGNDGKVMANLEKSRQILEFVDYFDWKFGEKMVHYRTDNAGLQAQWLEAWWPSSDTEFAFVVEDDLELSTWYFKFIKEIIINYYYNISNFSPSIYGASLQRPRFVPGKHGNKMVLGDEMSLFLYQLVGSWGQLLFPKPWKEFRLWYDSHRSRAIKPILEGMVTTGWYKKKKEQIWTPWFIKFVHSRGYFNLYTNLLNERALSVSHRDAGVNYAKTAGPDSYLLNDPSFDHHLVTSKPLKDLKWYDFCFREIHHDYIIRDIDELDAVLHHQQKQRILIFVNILQASERVIRNLLCHFERLNVQNYVLLGVSSEFLVDLARRGHTAVDMNAVLDSIKGKNLAKYPEYVSKGRNVITIEAHIINKCLKFGYSTWVVNGNILFFQEFISNFISFKRDFFIGKEVDLFFARSSSTSRNMWTQITSTISLLKGNDSFVNMMGTLLAQRGGAEFSRVNETVFAMNLSDSVANKTLSGGKVKMVFWADNLDVGLIEKRLDELGLWIVDEDASCLAVVCHKS